MTQPTVSTRVLVIGGSAGSIDALTTILPSLPRDFALPIALVVHLPATATSYLAEVLQAKTTLNVREIEDKDALTPGTLLIAPPNYHVLLEADGTCALSIDKPVSYSRPSIDVLFESAAEAFGDGTVGLLLSGANSDGAQGLARIGELGGITVVQSPQTSAAPHMPMAALQLARPQHVLPLQELGAFIAELGGNAIERVQRAASKRERV